MPLIAAMRNVLLVVAVIAAAVLWQRFGSRSEVALTPSRHFAGKSPCGMVERCVVVYMAPWCSACRRSEGLINALEERWKNDPGIALKVVVGQDHVGNLEEMAGRLQAPIFLDPRGAYFNAFGLRGVPHWIVKDRDGRVDTAFAGSYPDIEVHVARLGVERPR